MANFNTLKRKIGLLIAATLLAACSVHAFEDENQIQAPRTLEEVRESIIGKFVSPTSPESLVGQYLRQTKAQTVLRTFLTAPVGNVNPPSKQGPKRLVVGVSPQTFPAFTKLFSGSNMLYLFYEPNGSMQAAFMGKRGNLYLHDDVRFTAPGSMMIPIILSDTEASRAIDFFQLARTQNVSQYASHPWRLKSFGNLPAKYKVYLENPDLKPWIFEKIMASPHVKSYSSHTGFEGCTHWFTSIPLGDKLVDSYIFPRGPEEELGTNPLVQPLTPYDTPRGVLQDQEKLLRSVWKVPGNQQLGEMLNPMASRRGEFTNVGWIAYSLLGSQGSDRVPVVFLFVDDVNKPISPNYPISIRSQ